MADHLPDADEGVTAESLGKLDGPQRFANNGKKKLCAVPNCPKLSDGRRSNFMCRSHYTTTSLYRAEVEEEQRAREQEAAALGCGSDGDGTVDGGDGGGEDEEEEGGTGSGGGRRSRRNRKPSAKILRSVETEQVMKKEMQRRREEKFGKGGSGNGSSKGTGGGGERTSATSRATRVDYSALAGVNDDSSYASVVSYKKTKVVADTQNEDDDFEEASSTAGSSVAAEAARPSIPKTRHIIRVAAYPPAQKPAKTSLGPEPSYLFRKGPLPPPSPPIGPQIDPPAFPFQRPIAVNPQGQDQSLADTGIYANQIRRRVQADADASIILPLPRRTVGGVRDQVERTKQCNCKKSGCLKLYCDVSIWIHSLRLICTFCRHASFFFCSIFPVVASTLIVIIFFHRSICLYPPHNTTQRSASPMLFSVPTCAVVSSVTTMKTASKTFGRGPRSLYRYWSATPMRSVPRSRSVPLYM